jgi:hypothetical protein
VVGGTLAGDDGGDRHSDADAEFAPSFCDEFLMFFVTRFFCDYALTCRREIGCHYRLERTHSIENTF